MRQNKPSNNQRYRNADDQHNNYPSPQRNYQYQYVHPRKKSSTVAMVLIGIIGGAAASVGTMLYFKNHDTVTPPPAQPVQIEQQAPSANTQPAMQPVIMQAKILAVTPNYTMVDKPVKVCKMVESEVRVLNTNKSTTTGTAIGGATGAVAGGIIGNQIRQGGGGTIIGGVLGAATGALIGHEVQKANQPEYVNKEEQVKVCDTVTKSVKEVSSYDIRYTYNNQTETATSKKKYRVGTLVNYNNLQANFVR